MKKIAALILAACVATTAKSDLIISQYIETNSGTTPKGIELWNTGGVIDFSAVGFDLNILVGVNGGALASVFTLNTGTLGLNEVMVIGTADMGTYLNSTFGVGVVQFHLEPFTFNGDDALQVRLGGVATDNIGTPGVDPGTEWANNGVSTANQNIGLRSGIFTGDTDGWTDPSVRFENVGTGTDLTGFGVAVPEPTTMSLLGLSAMALAIFRRKLLS